MRRFDRQGFGFWALDVAATGTFIGFTGLNPLPDGVHPTVAGASRARDNYRVVFDPLESIAWAAAHTSR